MSKGDTAWKMPTYLEHSLLPGQASPLQQSPAPAHMPIFTLPTSQQTPAPSPVPPPLQLFNPTSPFNPPSTPLAPRALFAFAPEASPTTASSAAYMLHAVAAQKLAASSATAEQLGSVGNVMVDGRGPSDAQLPFSSSSAGPVALALSTNDRHDWDSNSRQQAAASSNFQSSAMPRVPSVSDVAKAIMPSTLPRCDAHVPSLRLHASRHVAALCRRQV